MSFTSIGISYNIRKGKKSSNLRQSNESPLDGAEHANSTCLRQEFVKRYQIKFNRSLMRLLA